MLMEHCRALGWKLDPEGRRFLREIETADCTLMLEAIPPASVSRPLWAWAVTGFFGYYPFVTDQELGGGYARDHRQAIWRAERCAARRLIILEVALIEMLDAEAGMGF